MKTGFATLLNAFRGIQLRWNGAELGKGGRYGSAICVRRGWRAATAGTVRLGDDCWLENGVELNAWGGSITAGSNIFIGPYTVVYGHGGVSIGSDSLISMHCRILSSNHEVGARDVAIRSLPDRLLPTIIGRDVWLGAGVTVLGGVTIGDGAVIGAGAVVTEDIPANAYAVGVPARVVKHRGQ